MLVNTVQHSPVIAYVLYQYVVYIANARFMSSVTQLAFDSPAMGNIQQCWCEF